MNPTPRPPPPRPGTEKPLRTYAVKLTDLVGRSAESLEAELGAPDSKTAGNCWVTPDGQSTIVYSGASVLRGVRVFGLVPRMIAPEVPYEVWLYHNVQGSEWSLYLTGPAADNPPVSAAPPAAPPPPAQRGLWRRFLDFLTGGGPGAAPIVPLGRRPTGPLTVCEVGRHPTGAIF